MTLLVDTNVFLEVLLNQARAEEARTFLNQADIHDFFISDYSFHSIGVLFFRKRQPQIFRAFVDDVILSGSVRIISLSPEEMGPVMEAAGRFGFDFDDAYQYATAQKFGLRVVTYDADFDRAEGIKLLPSAVLQG